MWKLEKTQKTCREINIESTRTELVMTSHLQLFIRDAGCEVEVSMSGAESPGPDPRTPAGNVEHHHGLYLGQLDLLAVHEELQLANNSPAVTW